MSWITKGTEPFSRTAHLLAWSLLLAALICSLTRLFATSLAHEKEVFVHE